MSVHPGGDMGGTGGETVHLVDRAAGGQGAGGLGGSNGVGATRGCL